MMNKINKFRGKYAFLSNFYPCIVEYDGWAYPSVEHAFQAAKSLDMEVRKGFRVCPSSADAKKLGRKVKLRPDWNDVKLSIMKSLVRDKFNRNIADVDLTQKLLDTGDCYLEEGNNHRDTFWGTVNGEGRNELGRILMEVRDELQQNAPSLVSTLYTII